MNSARYYLALIILVSLPPALLLWIAIHPLARFWRRLGPFWTYSLLAIPALGMTAVIVQARGKLLAVEYGTNYFLILAAAACVAEAVVIARQHKRHLTFAILAGIPELSESRYPGKLLTEGVYATIRHPRYVEVFFWVLGYAFFTNYLATYVLAALSVPFGLWIVFLEERELRERFGEEYEEYCRRVPRFVPSRRPG